LTQNIEDDEKVEQIFDEKQFKEMNLQWIKTEIEQPNIITEKKLEILIIIRYFNVT
jgi:hypothetical protein